MAEMAERKLDRETANTVRSGLIVLSLYGPTVAARWMRMRGVPLAVAHRVITRPAARRRSDFVLAAHARLSGSCGPG